MRRTRVILWLLACCLLAWTTATPAATDAGWQLVSEKNNIRVYRKDDATARIKTFRGVTRFPLENPAALEALLNDYPAIPRWMHFISKGEELARASYVERTLRFTTELPWPLSDRDVVTKMTVVQMSPDSLHIGAVADPAAPKTPDYVRIPELNGRFDLIFFRPTREVQVTYEIVMDPGGNIPGWAANIVLKDTPYFTLLKLRRLVQEPKYLQFRGTYFIYPW